MTGKLTVGQEVRVPWSGEKLGAVLAAACGEHFGDRYEFTLCSSDGTCEKYEVADAIADDGPLVLIRKSDGRRFEIDFFATATSVAPAVPEGKERI